jgi:cytoskeleton protein RodZ
MTTPPHSHDLDEVATIPVLRGPGEQLRSAREAAGTSVHEISTHMHLDSRVILALEADDYDQLPAPTFVRGYLRGYARLLDLDPEPIVRAFEQRDLAPPSLVADISVKSRVHGGDFPIRLVTYIVVAALIVLVVLWWRSQDFAPVRFDTPFTGDSALPEEESASVPQEAPEPQSAAPPASGQAAELQEETVTPVEAEASPETREPAVGTLEPDAQAVTSVTGETESGSPEETEAPVAETLALAAESGIAAGEDGSAEALGATDEVAAFALPAEGEAEPPQDLPADAAETGPEATGGEASAAEASPVETPSESPAPSAVPETTEVSPESAPSSPATGEDSSFVSDAPADRLQMSFTVECWLEVYDRDDERLFYGLAQPGEQLSLSGRGPIRVVLGNSDGVEVRYNGTPIEFASFVTRGVARFSVGGSPPEVTRPPARGAAAASDTQPAGEGEPESPQERDGEPAPAGG